MDDAHGFSSGTVIRLLRRIGQGDEHAFVELFRAINRRVFLFAFHRLGNREDAEEVLIDTAEELWRHPERYLGHSRFMTYVLGIANHRASDLLRRQGRRQEEAVEVTEDVADPDPTPFEVLIGKQKLACIARCMERLPQRQRVIVHLAYFEDLSREEIGRLLGCTDNAVRQHLHQALRNLKALLAGTGLT